MNSFRCRLSDDQWLASLSLANPDPRLVQLIKELQLAEETSRCYKRLVKWNWIMLGLILMGGGLVLLDKVMR